ncbi:hypothetical protein R5M92_04285 [Halomonas sp. Bachu 37]|uniref:hypothetical protein n=1 Tax=Halomonas kashgarensis TaxID=3084920 RepID=UPI003217D8A0
MYYHVTLKENLPSIQAHGLMPMIGRFSKELGETIPAVYLFPSAEACKNALLNWLGEAYEEHEEETGVACELVILELQPDACTLERHLEWEHVSHAPIPVAAIERILEEEAFGRMCLARHQLSTPVTHP